MTPILFAIFLSVLISVITLAIAINKRTAPKSHYYIIFALLITSYSVGRLFEASASSMEAAYLGVILAYIGLPYVSVDMLFFLLDYYNITKNKYLLHALLIPPFLSSVFVIVPQLRGFYYHSYVFFPGPPIAQVMVEGTLFYYILFAYNFLLLLICLGLSLWGAIKFNEVERKSSLSVFIAVVSPAVFQLLYVLGLTPLKLDLTPIALCFSLLLMGMAVHRFNLLRVLPLAKDAILEQMNDSFIIVDIENRFLDANATAKANFPILSDIYVGQKIEIATLFPNMSDGLDGSSLVSILNGGVQKYFHFSEAEIAQDGMKLCICYTLHDVTDTRTLMAELKSQATYDGLTNIYNRASFHQLASHELDRAREQGTAASVFAIDIDRFKEINDTYGHFCGDEAIKSIVDRIFERLRTDDIFGRVGGDEFNVLLPKTSEGNAMSLARSLQRIVSAEPLQYEDSQIIITISIGIAVFDAQRHTNLESLLIEADHALYRAKDAGRNAVHIYSSDA
jgi:diguanylate cyclase (GGDEF) domain